MLRPLASRLNALSTTNVTRAYNSGKIDAYEVLGIEEVGVQAETPARQGTLILREAGRAAARAGRRPPASGSGATPHEHVPSEEPAEEVLPEGRRFPEFYTVETVGDDRVCDICESYEGNTYTLAEARALIPAHPNCRCTSFR